MFPLAEATNLPIPNPNEDQYSSPTPSEDAPCSSTPSEAKQGEKNNYLKQRPRRHRYKHSITVTQNGRKHVPIQTISSVSPATPPQIPPPKKKNRGLTLLTSSPYVNEVKENAAEKRKQELRGWKSHVQKFAD